MIMSTIPLQSSETASLPVLQSLVERASDAFVLLDKELRILAANAQARRRYPGFSINPGTGFLSFLSETYPNASLDKIETAFHAMLSDDSVQTELISLNDSGSQIQLRLTLLDSSAADSAAPAFSVVLLQPESEAHFRHVEFILDASTDGIFIFNRANRIVYFNFACENMTGWKRGAAFETHECSNVLRCHNEAGESMSSEALCPAKIFFHRDSVPVPHEMLITTREGQERWVETNYSPIKNASGEVEFVVGIIRDIDERKRLESQLVQSKNLASLGQLISGIAHEIKNPLGIIMSSVEVLTNEDRPASERHEAAEYLKDEVRRLDERVKDFLAFARPKPLLVEEINLHALINKVVYSYNSLRSGRFRTRTEFCMPAVMVTGDPDHLHQVFLNLIINADQAMRFGGELLISTEMIADQLRVRLVDQGAGIPEDNLSRIFDPFFTTKSDGTGLGLSIVHQILTAHKCQYRVCNNEGKPGVTFELLFPVKRKPRD
jgi:PAS domain S-box-containing protein